MISIPKMMLTKESRILVNENRVRSRQVEETIALCENHREASHRLAENARELNRLNRRISRAESRFEVSLYQPDATRLQAEVDEDDKKVGLFHWTLYQLPDQYGVVMEQLYEENLSWRNICDLEGEPMPLSAVKRARDNALILMTVAIQRAKEGVQESESNLC